MGGDLKVLNTLGWETFLTTEFREFKKLQIFTFPKYKLSIQTEKECFAITHLRKCPSYVFLCVQVRIIK